MLTLPHKYKMIQPCPSNRSIFFTHWVCRDGNDYLYSYFIKFETLIWSVHSTFSLIYACVNICISLNDCIFPYRIHSSVASSRECFWIHFCIMNLLRYHRNSVQEQTYASRRIHGALHTATPYRRGCDVVGENITAVLASKPI